MIQIIVFIQLTTKQIKCIDDKIDGQGRKFTDGAGKISPDALKQVSIKLK
jgi:hypothetical protein